MAKKLLNGTLQINVSKHVTTSPAVSLKEKPLSL